MKIEHNLIGVTDVDFTQDENLFTGTETLQKHVYFVNDTSIAMAKKNFIMRFLKRIPLEDLERLVNFKYEDVELEGQYKEGAKFTAELEIPVCIYKAQGFESEEEFLKLNSSVDISTPWKLAAYKEWVDEDGSKEGLLKLINA